MEAQITSLTNSINSNGATGDGNFSSSNHDALQKSIDAAKAQLKTFSDFVNDDNNKTNGDVVDSSNCIGRLQALIDKAQEHMIHKVSRKTLKQLQQKKKLRRRELLIIKQSIHTGLAEAVIQMMLQIKQLHGILKANHIQLLQQHGKTRKIKHILTSMYLTMKRKQLK